MESLSTLHVVVLFLLLGVVVTACTRRAMPRPVKTVVADASVVMAADGTLREDIGIETLGGILTVLLPAGYDVPCSKAETFSTAHDNQQFIDITLYRGRTRLVKDCTLLGKYRLCGIPEQPHGQPQIRVSFEVTPGGIAIYAQDVQRKQNVAIAAAE